MSDFIQTLIGFAVGVVTGVGLTHYGEELASRLEPRKSPQGLWDMAAELQQSGDNLLALAQVVRALAGGKSLEEIEANMPPELKEAWEEWKGEHDV